MALVWLGTVGIATFLILWTYGTQPVVGDEAYHFRRAFNYYESPLWAMRLTHDPAYLRDDPSAIQYYDSCLWHLALALVWKITGSASVLAAQLYHAAYLVVLLVFTYLTGRALYGHRGGMWAWGLMATIPMNVLFAMVLYMEIPMLAFAAVAVYCLVRKRPICMGLSLGAMFLTKSPTATVLIPSLLAGAILVMGTTWRQRAIRTSIVAAAAMALLLPDMIWRKEHFDSLIMLPHVNVSRLLLYPRVIAEEIAALPRPLNISTPLNILDPAVFMQLFGVTGWFTVVVALYVVVGGVVATLQQMRGRVLLAGWCTINAPRDGSRQMSGVLGLMLVSYLCIYLVALHRCYDGRYLHPITLPLCLLTGGALTRWQDCAGWARRRRLCRGAIAVLVLAMGGQLLAAPCVIRQRRTLPEKVMAAMDWVRANTAPTAHILYLENNLTLLTGRPIVWFSAYPQYLFSVDEVRQMRLLRFLHVDYIAIHPTRQQNDSSPLEVPIAYPKPWVQSLAERPYLERVYPPPGSSGNTGEREFLIYHIDYSKMPANWLRGVENVKWTQDLPNY